MFNRNNAAFSFSKRCLYSSVGLQGFSKEIKLKKPPAEMRIARPFKAHLSHCNCYKIPKDLHTAATWPTPSCPQLENIATPYPASNQTAGVSEDPILPQPTSKCYQKTPSFPNQSSGQHVHGKTTPRTSLSLGYKNRHDMRTELALPDYQDVGPLCQQCQLPQ